MVPAAEEIQSLKEIVNKAKDYIGQEEFVLNFYLPVQFSPQLLEESAFNTQEELARKFQAYPKPDDMYINHGEYIKDNGIDHMIKCLKEKRNTNRALISLIDQDDIINSGDNPIPSFLILQTNIDDDKLFLTVYFRALEISTFLKINLEEIRMISSKILQKFDGLYQINQIELHIFAFRAYIKEDINTFIRPKIEMLDRATLLKKLEKKPHEIANLLVDKIQTISTIIDDNSFQKILNILEDETKSEDLNDIFKSTYFKILVKKIIEQSNRLKELREKDSHHKYFNQVHKEYQTLIKELIDEIKKPLNNILKLQKEFDLQHKGRIDFFEKNDENNIEALEHLIVCMVGEIGEFANIVKKIRRGDFSFQEKKRGIIRRVG